VARVLVFDVNETLLDLAALREPFSRAFGDPASMGEWFVRLLHGSLVATLTDTYDDFATIARRALDALAKREGRDLHVAERDTILGTMLELPAHRTRSLEGGSRGLGSAGTETVAGPRLRGGGMDCSGSAATA
jgi:2-haloacid dehalogenase